MKIPTLKKNDTIGLIAPAGPIKKSQIQAGIEVLQGAGFNLKFGKNLFNKHRYFSGTISERLSDLKMMLDDDQIKAIYAVRGGTGATQLLNNINFTMWQERKVLLIGFSDITSMQWALWVRAQLGSFSGMTLTSQLRKSNPFMQIFIDFLSGTKTSIGSEDFKKQLLFLLEKSIEYRRSDSIAWLLYYLHKFHKNIPSRIAQSVIEFGDCISLVILTKYQRHRSKVVAFAKNIDKTDLYQLDNYWLLLYQLYVNNLIRNPYKSDNTFNKLRSNNVSFLE